MTYNYCITFRIADRAVNGATYAERRQKLIDNTREEKLGYWEETTSFILAESALQTPQFAARVCRGLSDEYDMVVVFDPTDLSASYFGELEHTDVLRSFFPKLKKLP